MNKNDDFLQSLDKEFGDNEHPLRWICYDNSTLHQAIYAPFAYQSAIGFVDWVIQQVEQDDNCRYILELWLEQYQRDLAEKKAARNKKFGELFKQLIETYRPSNNELGKVLEGGHKIVSKWQNGYLKPEPTRPQLVALQKVGLPVSAVNELLAILGQPELTDEEIWYSDIKVIEPAAPVKVFNVPDKRSRQFVGREQQLLALRDGFTGKQHTQVISGLGGIGKTELAIQYAHRYRDQYQVIWWVGADEANQLAAEFNRLTTPLGLPGEKIDDTQLVKGIVLRWLAEHENWLLIFDNADQPEVLQPYLLEWGNKPTGHVLITSRVKNWGTSAKATPLEVFSPTEALEFLHLTTQETDDAALARLAETLGYLPLALEQAVAYLQATDESAAGYVEIFQSHSQTMLTYRPQRYDEHNRTIATVWEISLQRLAQQSPPALALLRLCAFLAPDDIPFSLLLDRAKSLPDELGQALTSRFELNELITKLYDYSLIERRGDSLSVHRLVQAVIRGQLSAEEQLFWLENTARLLVKAFGNYRSNTDSYNKNKRYFPHVLNLIQQAETSKLVNQNISSLLGYAGNYLGFNGDYPRAQSMLEKSLLMSQSVFGAESAETARVYQALGQLFQEQGDFAKAEANLEHSLTLYEATRENQLDMANCLNDLGDVFYDKGQFKIAQAYYEQALKIQQQLFPNHNHADIAASLTNLGTIQQAQGHLTLAHDYFIQALRMKEATLGRQHLSTATTLNNLAGIFLAKKQWPSAQTYLKEALIIKTAILGEQHPELCSTLNNLGGIHQMEGEFPQAQAYYERVLTIGKQLLGRDHPDTATFLLNLGNFLIMQGKREEARPYLEQALRIREKVFGKKHEKTLRVKRVLQSITIGGKKKGR